MAEHLSFRQGVRECLPTLLGYVGIGLSFGIAATSSGFHLIEIILLSLLVYAGSAQFVICSLVIAGTPLYAIVLTTFIINSRMFLLSLTLAPNFKNYGILNRIGLASLVTDETFGVAITPHVKGEKINDRWLHGLNITAYTFWTLASIAGALFGKQIKNPESFGLDFAIIAMFIFLAVSQFETISRKRISIYVKLILSTIVMMFGFSLFVPTYIAILIASTLAALLGVVLDR